MPRTTALPFAILPLLTLQACATGAPRGVPLAQPAPVCPLEGCDRAKIAAIQSAATPSVCPGAGEAPCAGEPAAQCTHRALSAWTEAADDRAVACIAKTLSDACELGDPTGCLYAGRMALDGRGVARDAQRGLSLLVRACDGDVAIACRVAVRWLADGSHGRLVTGTQALADRLDRQYDCLVGKGEACFSVGLRYSGGLDGFPLDAARSAAAYARGCEAGQSLSCNNLGDAHEYGRGVPRDLERAATLYQRACGLGEELGCANLGHLFENGEGVARDVARARALYADACRTGDPYACLHGEMTDSHGGLESWQRSCDRGDARACAFVGIVFEDGPDGYHRDKDRSMRAMERACKLGDRRGCAWVAGRSGS
ncbi:MAG TPA: tetratricopeptide repeat protein [Polyangiaceae bacterium]